MKLDCLEWSVNAVVGRFKSSQDIVWRANQYPTDTAVADMAAAIGGQACSTVSRYLETGIVGMHKSPSSTENSPFERWRARQCLCVVAIPPSPIIFGVEVGLKVWIAGHLCYVRQHDDLQRGSRCRTVCLCCLQHRMQHKIHYSNKKGPIHTK